jgi:hypothetical protein
VPIRFSKMAGRAGDTIEEECRRLRMGFYCLICITCYATIATMVSLHCCEMHFPCEEESRARPNVRLVEHQQYVITTKKKNLFCGPAGVDIQFDPGTSIVLPLRPWVRIY